MTETTAMTAKSLFDKDSVKKKFQELLGQKSQGFITSVLQIVASNNLLSKADPMSIFNAAATAATLDLPLNNNLGLAYIIPYNQKYKEVDEKGKDIWKVKVVAQFQIGYKGFIQLAQRSGQYKTISASPIYEGQLISENPLTGYMFDFTVKPAGNPIGFACYFKLINGFEKVHYMTSEEMSNHGVKFSKSYANSDSIWKKDFIGMGNKTVIKLLISKFGPLSIEMQKAVHVDQAIINNEDGTEVTYIDNEPEVIEPKDHEAERLQLLIEDCKTVEEVSKLATQLPDADWKLFEERKEQIENERK